MTVLEQLQKAIEDGHPGDTEKLVKEAMKQHISSARIVEEAMTPAMRTVGENYKSNGADIIKILAAARSVRKGFELLEEQDAQFSRRNIGTVILGTVEGDLHDVGKNLVAIMFRSAGFKVIDLGVDISEKQFMRAVKQNPDVSIVCISSLLSTSIPEMEQVVFMDGGKAVVGSHEELMEKAPTYRLLYEKQVEGGEASGNVLGEHVDGASQLTGGELHD